MGPAINWSSVHTVWPVTISWIDHMQSWNALAKAEIALTNTTQQGTRYNHTHTFIWTGCMTISVHQGVKIPNVFRNGEFTVRRCNLSGGEHDFSNAHLIIQDDLVENGHSFIFRINCYAAPRQSTIHIHMCMSERNWFELWVECRGSLRRTGVNDDPYDEVGVAENAPAQYHILLVDGDGASGKASEGNDICSEWRCSESRGH